MRVSQFLEKLPFGSNRRKTQIQNTYYPSDPRLSREELELLFENNTKYLTNRRLTFEDVFRDRKRREEEEEEIEEFEEEVDEIEEFEEEERELEDEIEEFNDDKEFQASSYQFLNSLSLAHQSIRQDDPELARLIRIKMKSIIQPIVSPAGHVSLTERVMQLYPNHKLTQKELFDIGKRAKELYVNRYRSLPMQKMSVFDGKERWVNYYTREHLGVLDEAINKVLF